MILSNKTWSGAFIRFFPCHVFPDRWGIRNGMSVDEDNTTARTADAAERSVIYGDLPSAVNHAVCRGTERPYAKASKAGCQQIVFGRIFVRFSIRADVGRRGCSRRRDPPACRRASTAITAAGGFCGRRPRLATVPGRASAANFVIVLGDTPRSVAVREVEPRGTFGREVGDLRDGPRRSGLRRLLDVPPS